MQVWCATASSLPASTQRGVRHDLLLILGVKWTQIWLPRGEADSLRDVWGQTTPKCKVSTIDYLIPTYVFLNGRHCYNLVCLPEEEAGVRKEQSSQEL